MIKLKIAIVALKENLKPISSLNYMQFYSMRKLYCSVMLTFLCWVCNGQNLIPNPGFEDSSDCYVTEWSDYIISQSPDYFSGACQQGFQQPYDGTAYVGLYTMVDTLVGNSGTLANYREIVGIKLLDSLTIGKTYHFSMHVSLSDCINCATNNLGALLSTTPIEYTEPIILPNRAQVYSTAIITDTLNWVNIAGSFVADSNYKYLFIGNFFDNLHTDTLLTKTETCWGTSPSFCIAYYYIDNVCLSTTSKACHPSVGLETANSADDIKVFPNPFFDELLITTDRAEDIRLRILDVLGRAVHVSMHENSSVIKPDISHIPQGVYFLEIYKDKKRSVYKVLKGS